MGELPLGIIWNYTDLVFTSLNLNLYFSDVKRYQEVKENIIRGIQKGQGKAFQEVFDEYFNALAAFAYKYVEEIEVSEDLVQEVFISFWEKRADFDHVLAIKSFLYTSVRNKCLNHIKHEKVKKKHEASLVYDLESEQSFGSHVIEEEVFNSLYRLIKDLPKASKEIMLLALNGMKNPEIADELGVSVNTVKTQKKIAYSKIKDSLGPMLQGILLFLLQG